MSFFTSAQGFEITGGHFTSTVTSVVINNDGSGSTGIDILREASVPEAAYDSSARAYSPRCFPGTRRQYIEDVLQWASPAIGDAPTPMYWMRGPAGVGKSAIAQTCAEKLQELGVLGAAFFFSINGRDKPETLFPSIAYQLSTMDPAYRDLINKKICHDKTLVSKAMAFQFQYLIKDPLHELAMHGKGMGKRVVVLIDGLDECEGADAQCEIINIVAAAVSDGILPLCWAFFSRPDPHIEATFFGPTIDSQCSKIILPISRDADGEIGLYLRNGFENILRRRHTSLRSQWPSAEDMETIVGAADGSFIYATTVLRFVGQLDALGPQRRLQAVVEVIMNRRQRDSNSDTGITPFAELDAFYTMILQRIPKEIFPSVHLLLALLFRLGGRSVIVAANILRLSNDEFETICNHACSVIRFECQGKGLELDPTIDANCSYMKLGQHAVADISRKIRLDLGGRVSFYHKSFYDFLLEPERSGSYCVRGSQHLARHLVKIHLDYDQSFCWHGSELVLAPGIPESASSLSYPYTNELVNSLIKAYVYYHTGAEDSQSFSVAGQAGGLDADCDFRKRLHIVSHLVDHRPSIGLRWGCRWRFKWFPGTLLAWVSSEEFSKFNIIEFKQMVVQHIAARIIQPYHRNLTSWVKTIFHSLLCIKHQEHIESGLHCIGHGEKSIFWYWEINYKLQHYREFRTINLAEGERLYLEEDFGLWPEHEFESDSDSRVESVTE